MRQEKSSLLRNKGFQSLLASLLCIVLGLLIGYIVLLIINPAGAGEAIRTIVENFLYYPSAAARLRYLGNTLVKTAPLLMCSLSVLFAYKVLVKAPVHSSTTSTPYSPHGISRGSRVENMRMPGPAFYQR